MSTPKNAYDLVLHDWNGCLLNDVPHCHTYGVAIIFKQYGVPVPSIEDYCQHISSDFMEYYYSRGIPSTGCKKTDGDTLNAIMVSSMAHAPIPPLFPETRLFLQLLAEMGLKQTLVSALEAGEFRRQFDHHGLHDFFAEAHGGIRKKAELFAQLIAKYGTVPERTVGVTDSMSDVRALESVGATAILVPRGYTVPDTAAYPKMIVADDLLDAFRHISG